jgi:hypothetical protein
MKALLTFQLQKRIEAPLVANAAAQSIADRGAAG